MDECFIRITSILHYVVCTIH